MATGRQFAVGVVAVLFSLSVLISAFAQSQPEVPGKDPLQKDAVKKDDKAGIEFFEKKIRPVLVTQCYECHAADSKKVKGGLLLDTRDGIRKGGESGAAVVPGNAGDSLLIEALKYDGLEMPPKQKLPDSVIADFVKWVEMGAPDPREGKAAVVRKEINFEEAKNFWAFQPPKVTAPPKVKNTAWPRTDIDKFILAQLEEKKLRPVADADKATLLRRVTFDLTGLPPTPEELTAFLGDKSPTAFEKVVDRLLASPRFGERWGRHWFDVARYAESTGKERNIAFPYAWRYRDYVIDAFNTDKPYDRFITEQVAGDLLPAANDDERRSHLIATGFLTLGPKSVNEKNAEQFLMDTVDEQIDVTTRAVLATTVGCARCHDHKFDPIPTADYYAMAGIFKSTSTLAGIRSNTRAVAESELLKLGATTLAAATGNAGPNPNQEEIDKLEKELLRAREILKDPKIVKKAKQKGKGDVVERAKDRIAELEAKLAKLGYAPNASAKTDKKTAASPAGDQYAMAVQDARKPADCEICIRGEVKDRGPSVPRDFVTVLKTASTPKVDPLHSGRLELAQWLVSRDNPLAARVMVNRIWYHLFGTGIVETVDNFGALGERPSHPELLDLLAVRFMDEQKWSVKQAIRGIVLSRTYQLDSRHDDANYAIDPENRLVWRMTRRRLDAEAIRDATLAASGKLDVAPPSGSSVMNLASGEIGRNVRVTDLGVGDNHRSVYLPLLRGIVPEMLNVFDAADPSLVVGQREVTTVATQALFMMNSPFVIEQSEALAKRLVAQSSMDDAARVELAYQLTLGRGATSIEKQRVIHYLDEVRKSLPESTGSGKTKITHDRTLDAWTTFCQTLFASAEFRYVY